MNWELQHVWFRKGHMKSYQWQHSARRHSAVMFPHQRSKLITQRTTRMCRQSLTNHQFVRYPWLLGHLSNRVYSNWGFQKVLLEVVQDHPLGLPFCLGFWNKFLNYPKFVCFHSLCNSLSVHNLDTFWMKFSKTMNFQSTPGGLHGLSTLPPWKQQSWFQERALEYAQYSCQVLSITRHLLQVTLLAIVCWVCISTTGRSGAKLA